MDIAALQNDPEFSALPFTEKVKAIATLDSQFAALPVEEQHKGLAMIFQPDVRESIAERKQFPPATAAGDPNAQGITGGDIGKAAGRGLLHLAGIPTSVDELSQKLQAGMQPPPGVGLLMHPVDTLKGVAAPFQAVSAPAVAVGHGNAPTRDENLGAIESGTQLAATAASMHPSLGALAGKVGDGLAAVAAKEPLSESIGSRIVARKGAALLPTADVEVQKFTNPESHAKQVQALAEKYPQADILDNGETFTVKSPTQPAGAPAASDAGFKRSAVGATVGGAIGAAVGHPGIGAAIGGVVPNIPAMVRNTIESPLWKAASGSVKRSLIQAAQSGDTATVAAIAARVKEGQNLTDEYGHDAALHSLVTNNSPADLHNYDAYYIAPDGQKVQVPHSVLRQTINAIAN